jgi:hypothetical protein
MPNNKLTVLILMDGQGFGLMFQSSGSLGAFVLRIKLFIGSTKKNCRPYFMGAG